MAVSGHMAGELERLARAEARRASKTGDDREHLHRVAQFWAGAQATQVSGVDDATWPKLVAYARSVGADPRDWAAVMLVESQWNPTAANMSKAGHIAAVGLNQFNLAGSDGVIGTPGSAFEGVTGQAPTQDNAQAFRQLPASSQLDYTAKAWLPFYRRFPGLAAAGARDLHWLNFLPTTYKPGQGDDYLIRPPGSSEGKDNTGLTSDDGAIRAGNFRNVEQFWQTKLAARWASILAAIAAAESSSEAAAFVVKSPIHVTPFAPSSPTSSTRSSSSSGGDVAGVLLVLAVVAGVVLAKKGKRR